MVRHIAKPPFLYETDYFYDENDNLIQVAAQNIDDQGLLQPNTHFTTTYEYDSLDNLIHMSQEVDEGETITTEYEYDSNENQTLIRYGEATNGNQPTNVVRTLYDERDLSFRRIRAEGDADQSTMQYDYDGNENLTVEHAGLEDTPRVTVNQYDGFDRLTSITDPMGNVTTYHYDANGNRVSARTDGELIDVVGIAGNVRLAEATYAYDEIDCLCQTDAAFFDPQTGSPIADGLATTKAFYNALSQVIRIEDDNAHIADTAYDTANRRSAVSDHRGNTITYGYDASSVAVGTRVSPGPPHRSVRAASASQRLRDRYPIESLSQLHQHPRPRGDRRGSAQRHLREAFAQSDPCGSRLRTPHASDPVVRRSPAADALPLKVGGHYDLRKSAKNSVRRGACALFRQPAIARSTSNSRVIR